MCDENSYLTKCLFNNLVFSTCKRHEYEEKPIRSLRSQWTNCVHLKPPLPLAIEFSLNESEIAEHSAVCNYCYETDTQCCTGRKPDAHRLRLWAWHCFGLRIRWKVMILSNPNLAVGLTGEMCAEFCRNDFAVCFPFWVRVDCVT